MTARLRERRQLAGVSLCLRWWNTPAGCRRSQDMVRGQKRAPGSLPGTGTRPARWVGYCVAACLSLTCATAATHELSGAEIEGRNIVQHLLAQRPAENFTNTGTLKIRDAKRQRTEVQVKLQTFVTETN